MKTRMTPWLIRLVVVVSLLEMGQWERSAGVFLLQLLLLLLLLLC